MPFDIGFTRGETLEVSAGPGKPAKIHLRSEEIRYEGRSLASQTLFG